MPDVGKRERVVAGQYKVVEKRQRDCRQHVCYRYPRQFRRDVAVMVVPEFVVNDNRGYHKQDNANPWSYFMQKFSHSRFVFLILPTRNSLAERFGNGKRRFCTPRLFVVRISLGRL